MVDVKGSLNKMMLMMNNWSLGKGVILGGSGASSNES